MAQQDSLVPLRLGADREAPGKVAPATPSPKTRATPSDWQWQVRNAVTSLSALESKLRLTEAERQGAKHAEREGFSLSITPYYLSLCDKHDAR